MPNFWVLGISLEVEGHGVVRSVGVGRPKQRDQGPICCFLMKFTVFEISEFLRFFRIF